MRDFLPGAIQSVIRFICHVPLGYYGITVLGHRSIINKHSASIIQPPLSGKIQNAQNIAGGFGIFAFAWNFLLFAAIMLPAPFFIFVGLVDAAIVAALSYSLSIESTYVPKSKSVCNHLRPYKEATQDRTEIFFHRVGATNATNPNFDIEKCGQWYSMWALGIFIVTMYGVCCLVNLSLGLISLTNTSISLDFGRNRSYNRRSSKPRRKWYIAIAFFPVDLIHSIFRCFFTCLPYKLQEPIRFNKRRSEKWWERRKSVSARKSTAIDLTPREVNKTDGPLSRFLIHDVAVLVARELHYKELVNFSLASKGIRMALFPPPPPGCEESAGDRLRVYSCRGKPKADCWGCGVQVCDDCKVNRRVKKTKASFHMDLCQAVCGTCLYRASSVGNCWKCNCNDERSPTYYNFSSWRRRQISNDEIDVVLCTHCALMSTAKFEAAAEKRDEVIYRRLFESNPGLTCGECRNQIASKGGTVWWACRACSSECRSDKHPHAKLKVDV